MRDTNSILSDIHACHWQHQDIGAKSQCKWNNVPAIGMTSSGAVGISNGQFFCTSRPAIFKPIPTSTRQQPVLSVCFILSAMESTKNDPNLSIPTHEHADALIQARVHVKR